MDRPPPSDAVPPDEAAAAPHAAPGLVGVVRNPRSHRNRRQTAEAVSPGDVTVVAPANRDELERDLAALAARRVGLLVVDGGDGTLRDILTRGAAAFGKNWPRFIVLPKGKTNALAKDLGVPDKWPLEQALADAARGKATVRHPILVERLDEAARPAMGFVLGAGVFNDAIDAGQVAHRWGAFNSFAVGLSAAAGVLQALFGIGNGHWRRQAPMRVLLGPELQEAPHSGRGNRERRFVAGFSTLQRFPLGMRPFGRSAGVLRYALVDAPLRRVMGMMPLLLAGWDRPSFAALGVHRGGAEEMVLDLGGRFILDGESFPPGRYRLSLGPALEFVTP